MAVRVPQSKMAPAGSAFRMVLKSGAVTVVAANDPIASLRWTSSAYRAVIQRVNVEWSMTTAFGTAQDVAFGLYFASAFTASDSGGTAATLTGRNGKLDTLFPLSTQIATGNLRIGTTGAITAGTRTLDTQPLAAWNGMINTLGQGSKGNLGYNFGENDAMNPITLRQNEGLVLNNLVLMGAGGVMTIYVTLEWTEVPIGIS